MSKSKKTAAIDVTPADQIEQIESIPESPAEVGAPADEQRLPAAPEQVEDIVEAPQGAGEPPAADDSGASSTTTPDANPPAPASSLFAVTVVNLAGRYYAPGEELGAEHVDRAGAVAIEQLLEAGAIRQG